MKKGQEEMIGFVLIIVLVAVVALVFLAIQIRKPPELQESKRMQGFVYSSLEVTSDCQSRPEEVMNIKELIENCDKNEKCLDNRPSCEVLNNTIRDIMNNEFKIGPRYKGYDLTIVKENRVVLSMNKGNNTNNMIGTNPPLTGLNISLKVYY